MFWWDEVSHCQDLLDASGFGPAERIEVTLVWESSEGALGLIEMLRNASVRSRALLRGQTSEALVAIEEGLRVMMEPFCSDGIWRVPAAAFVVAADRAA